MPDGPGALMTVGLGVWMPGGPSAWIPVGLGPGHLGAGGGRTAVW